MNIDMLLFFDGKPIALSLCERFLERAHAELGDFCVKVQKTQITLSARRVFACVSMMRIRPRRELPAEYIVITFGLPAPVDSPRIDAKTQPYPNRWTHHVLISSPEDIDADLMTWIREACAFARIK